jgi:tRNA G10  N-methylase Trm11
MSAKVITTKQEYEALLPKLTSSEFESLKRSIKEIGLQVPLIVNQDGILLDGHHRYKAYQELGFVQRPETVLRIFSNPSEEKRFLIKLNRDRRHLTKFQRIELEYKLETIEEELAKKRMSDAGREGANKRWIKKEWNNNSHQDGNTNNDGVVQSYTSPRETNRTLEVRVRPSSEGRVIDVSARNAYVSPMTYYKGREIIKNAPEEIKEKLRQDKLKIDKVFRQLQRQRLKDELIRSSIKESKIELSNCGIKLLHGDFIEKSRTIADDSIDLIFTDPPYGKQWLPLYESLAETASRVLKKGGSLVTNLGHHLIPEVIEYTLKAGLNYQWILAVKLAGPFSRFHARGVTIKTKPLLWFIKGDKYCPVDYISDLIESAAPEKVVDNWEQSAIEADHVISRLTVENQIVFDPMMGSGTTVSSCVETKSQICGH